MISCMGGWCKVRESCYHYSSEFQLIDERLCKTKEHYRHVFSGAPAQVSCPQTTADEAGEPGKSNGRT